MYPNILFSVDVCCTNTLYSLMLYLMDMLGMLITKYKILSMHFYANCSRKIPLILTWHIQLYYQSYYALLDFASKPFTCSFYNAILLNWYDTDKNTALTLHTLILRKLHLNDI